MPYMRASFSFYVSLTDDSIASWHGKWVRGCVWNSSLEYAYLFMTFISSLPLIFWHQMSGILVTQRDAHNSAKGYCRWPIVAFIIYIVFCCTSYQAFNCGTKGLISLTFNVEFKLIRFVHKAEMFLQMFCWYMSDKLHICFVTNFKINLWMKTWLLACSCCVDVCWWNCKLWCWKSWVR